MKVTFVGGGALRLLGILRGAMARGILSAGDEVTLYDLNVPRAEAVGRLAMRTPEYAQAPCTITWDATLEEALTGADMVGVILMTTTPRSYHLGSLACMQHGFIPSDNVSPNGAFLAVKGASLLLDIARKMERYCPQAWLVDFANPVAVFSGMVNLHTRIKALGVCAGHTNHQWDIPRLLGVDAQWTDIDVDVAGVNHLSFVLRGSVRGRELFAALDDAVTTDQIPELQAWWPESSKANIRHSVTTLRDLYRRLGVLVFSSEGDGLMHLQYDTAVERMRAQFVMPTEAEIARHLQEQAESRAAMDRRVRALLARELDDAFWAAPWQQDLSFGRPAHDVFVEILAAIAGKQASKVAVSRPHHGAVDGLPARTVLEFSQVLTRETSTPVDNLAIPPVVYGLTAALATHQTMLADALATDDPRLLAHALLAYPIHPYSRAARNLYRDLLTINADEMPAPLRTAADYL